MTSGNPAKYDFTSEILETNSILLVAQHPMFSHEHKNPPERYVNASILRQGCVEAAAEVLAKVDLRVDPCEDFYQFACGNYISSSAIADDKVDRQYDSMQFSIVWSNFMDKRSIR